MPDDDPELVICCAQQRTGIAPGGLPAETFTISRGEVRIGDDVVPTDRYLAVLPDDLAVERCVSSWIATSGAAFASAMGRMSKGSTNALDGGDQHRSRDLAAEPRVVTDPNTRFPRVRLGYLLKEILGWYDPADRYVFVADGGHWENLGLVELLRRRCRTILCLDASGDTVGAFTTLRQAVELAGLELPDVVVDIDLTGLDTISPGSAALPGGLVASLTVTYRGPGEETFTGTIHYAKAQVASSLDITLRRYAKADRRFPNYSTGDQFLRDEQFRQLVELGRAAGDELVKLAARRVLASPPSIWAGFLSDRHLGGIRRHLSRTIPAQIEGRTYPRAAVGFTRAELESFRGATVPDLVGPGLRLLFVGINPGLWTAATSTHFAHPGNRFYPALLRAGVIDRPIDRGVGMTDDDRRYLVERGIGITNLVARATPRAAEIAADELREGGQRLRSSSPSTARASSPSPGSPRTAPPSTSRGPCSAASRSGRRRRAVGGPQSQRAQRPRDDRLARRVVPAGRRRGRRRPSEVSSAPSGEPSGA